MISAFGVVHKAMSGPKFKALINTRRTGTGRAQEYANARLRLHRQGRLRATSEQSKDYKSTMSNATRTRDGDRVANRKAAFSTKVT